jgi:hypothetical protein
MNWTEAITQWEAQQRDKYGTKSEDGNFVGFADWPEQDITVTYNGKELCHYNGDYKNGAIKKAIQSTFIGTKKNREYQESEQ